VIIKKQTQNLPSLKEEKDAQGHAINVRFHKPILTTHAQFFLLN
jgi:hypothetical protein